MGRYSLWNRCMMLNRRLRRSIERSLPWCCSRGRRMTANLNAVRLLTFTGWRRSRRSRTDGAGRRSRLGSRDAAGSRAVPSWYGLSSDGQLALAFGRRLTRGLTETTKLRRNLSNRRRSRGGRGWPGRSRDRRRSWIGNRRQRNLGMRGWRFGAHRRHIPERLLLLELRARSRDAPKRRRTLSWGVTVRKCNRTSCTARRVD